ncbi:DUF2935 domain-containing protein [Ammoniphilus sp. YIM 78166]|uniref:DUF2935 domain-containing protein n=1 Tax=Ammoniphilus sp. YIM 78166 TaxID=1644106 RepID=UPI00196B3969|nr:DUF2935 domain-containing protein [Ammoniphilus sp. YIM 78166]
METNETQTDINSNQAPHIIHEPIDALPDWQVEPAQDDLFMRMHGGRILSDQEFIRDSLEENRFFLRIKMEHAFFLKISLPDDAHEFLDEANSFQNAFESQLNRSLHETYSPGFFRRWNWNTIQQKSWKPMQFMERILEKKNRVQPS